MVCFIPGLNEKKKILLVDDDELHISIAVDMLKEEYEVIPIKSGKETLEYLLQGFVPDLILLDILMPNMDGWETFNRIRAISFLRDIPVAFLTSLHEESDEKHAQEIGAADFIKKPYEREDLLKRIEIILGKKPLS